MELTMMMIKVSSSLSVRIHMEKQTQILTRLATTSMILTHASSEDDPRFTPEGDFVHALDFADDTYESTRHVTSVTNSCIP
jgi:hypothetical protein